MATTVVFRSRFSSVMCWKWQNYVIPICFNSNRTALCRTNRNLYLKTYPTQVVLPNGATIVIRYQEPRKMIKLPLDISTLSEADRKARLLKRKPKQKVVIEDEVEDDFDLKSYSHLWKKQ
ncbi:hypothetical protein SNE40_004349 [Patella caerulea]|uniref:39S ribosomal protein L55, mitochondrial n=1 Tax=Patella caerulea TaxID=87958 RepID=A0AAN8K8K7_PATCE